MRDYRRRAKQARALAHPVRLQLLEALRQPSCVCDLVALTRKRQPYVSQQLAILRQAGLVESKREGLQVRYRLAGAEVAQLIDDLRATIADPKAAGVFHPRAGSLVRRLN